MAKNTKATEYVDQETGEVFDQLPDDIETGAGLVQESVGFPPYWKPAVGKKIWAKVLGIDIRDPEFHRFVLEAGHETTCKTGPTDDAETVKVQKGEPYTMSVYAALPLERFFGEWVKITVKSTREMKDAKKNDMFVFSCEVTADTKARLAAKRGDAASRMGFVTNPALIPASTKNAEA